MYNKNLIWVGSLLATLVACSSNSDSSPPSGAGAPGSSGAAGKGGASNSSAGTAGVPSTSGGNGTAGSSGSGASGASAGASNPVGGASSGGASGAAGGTNAGAGGTIASGAGGTAAAGAGGASAGASASGAGAGGAGAGGAGAGGAGAGGAGAGGAGAGGSSAGNSATAGSGGSSFVPGSSDIPIPSGPGNVPKPTGTPGNLTILNWGGFKGATTFTFDDSLQSQIDNYSKFKATGVRMTFYLVCNNNGSNTAWKQMVTDGQELGNHTEHHCYANGTGCGWGTFTSIDQELDDCTAHLKSTYGVKDVYTMASPMGDSGWDTAASTRFLANRGVNDIANGVAPNDGTNPFELPCHVAAAGETAASTSTTTNKPHFNDVIDSTAAKGIWRIILNHSVSLQTNDGYNPVDANEVAAAMTYAKGLGTVWVDTLANVAAYWRAQKLITPITPTTSGSTKTWSWTLPAHFPTGRYLRVKVDGGTLTQNGAALTWDAHGYYEVALDVGAVSLGP